MHAFVCGSPSSFLRPYSTASNRRHFLDSDRRNSFTRLRNPLQLVEGQSQLQHNCQRPLATSCDPRVSMEGNQQSRPQEALQKPIDPISERNDDMEEAYGEGYATFSNDEGFGGVYSSPFEGKPSGGSKGASAQHSRDESAFDTTVGGKGIKEAQEFDCTQGSPVAEKERSSRHGVGFTGDQRPS